MKKLLIILISLLVLPSIAQARGEQAIGGTLSFMSKFDSPAVSMFYQYRVMPMLRISPEIGWAIRHKQHDALFADLNAQVPLAIGAGTAEIYPLAGLNYTRWNYHWRDAIDDIFSGHVNHYSRLGVNVGAGFQLQASSNILLKIEAKYIITDGYSTFVAGLGVGYIF